MSGGSFDYLCYKDASEIFNHSEQLRAMAERLREMGNQDIALDTLALFELAELLNSKIKRLSPVWKAVEWYDSGDWGSESIIEETNIYREKNQTL